MSDRLAYASVRVSAGGPSVGTVCERTEVNADCNYALITGRWLPPVPKGEQGGQPPETGVPTYRPPQTVHQPSATCVACCLPRVARSLT